MIDKKTKIQYEIVENKNEKGEYVPKYDKLIAEAPNEKIKSEWIEAKEVMGEEGFAFKLICIVQQKCGHYEILQYPFNDEYDNLEDVLGDLAEDGVNRKCTKCTCNFSL